MRSVQSTLLYKWFDEVWNKSDEDAIDGLMTNDSTAQGILTDDQPKGAEGFKIFFKDFKSRFHDIKIDVDDVISQDDIESARTTVSAIHTESGKNVRFSGMCMVKIVGGKIAEAWNNYDFLNLYEQLGQKLTPVESQKQT
ncbi:MAG: ester cyclase [Chitinophagaceae bacterium]|nr:ester cyclase [Chitinophagaceae bacterium]